MEQTYRARLTVQPVDDILAHAMPALADRHDRQPDNDVTHAAVQLGMSHSALSEWVARRTLDIDDEGADDDDE